VSNTKKAKPTTADKDGKTKLVRDSFTIPKNEYAALDALKTRALQLGLAAKKSELLRAGLMALSTMGDAAYKTALSAVPTLKTGRPSKKDEKADQATAMPAPKAAPATAKKAVKTTPAKKVAPAPVAKKAPVRKAAARRTTA
jgi:hypothetical protein